MPIPSNSTQTPATQTVIDPAAARNEAETHSFTQATSETQLQMTQSMIDNNMSKVNNYKNQEETIQNRLSPPPTKTVPDGKSSKEVVDEQEVAKLEGQLNAATSNREAAEKEVAQGVVDAAQLQAQAKEAQSNANTSNNQAQNAEDQLSAANTSQQQNSNNTTNSPGNSSSPNPTGTTNPNGSGSQSGSSGTGSSGSGSGSGSGTNPITPTGGSGS